MPEPAKLTEVSNCTSETMEGKHCYEREYSLCGEHKVGKQSTKILKERNTK